MSNHHPTAQSKSLSADQIRAKASSLSCERFMEWSQLLWQQDSFEQMITTFLTIIDRNFSLKASGVDNLVVRSTGVEAIPDISTPKPMTHVLRVALRKALLQISDLSGPDFRNGINSVRVESGDSQSELCFVLLTGDPAADWQVVYWTMNHDGPLPVEVEFISRQVQHLALWFRRLDRTQDLVFRDDLTGLYNSRFLEVVIADEIRRAQRFRTEFCLLFIDLDNFKPVNDRYGHMAGSEVLQQAADVLRNSLREIDFIIRYGGDEFVVLLLGSNSRMGLLAAERIRRQVETHRFKVSGAAHVELTCSIGVAAFPEHGHDSKELLRLADETMYRSKRDGKNRATIVGGKPLTPVVWPSEQDRVE